MGYYVRALPWKKKPPQWKVQFISYKNADIGGSPAKKPKKEWDIAKDRWRSLGFYHAMTVAEARSRASQLNSQLTLKRQEERIYKIEVSLQEKQIRFEAVLPEEFVSEFEQRFIRHYDSQTKDRARRRTRAYSMWQAAQRMIVAVGVEPSEWFYYGHEIYEYFYQKQFSLRYILSILKLANLWGFFISRKMARPFLPVPVPRGYERQRLIDEFYRKERRSRRASDPLSPEMLSSVWKKMNALNYHWLYLTVWLGLRPQEVDNLHDRALWRVEKLYNGRELLWVFQTKIVALPPEDRWKPIPILFDEQKFALKIIRDASFKRPLMKTVKKYLGDKVDLYGGRKGFVDLMLSREQSLENISVWMGHSTLNRTWRSYKNRRKFHLR